jgi:hypothetical protein
MSVLYSLLFLFVSFHVCFNLFLSAQTQTVSGMFIVLNFFFHNQQRKTFWLYFFFIEKQNIKNKKKRQKTNKREILQTYRRTVVILKCFFPMPRSTKMLLEQSNLAIPPTVWLHVNGVSLTTDIHTYEPPVHSYDYRTKHLQSPVQPPTPPLITPTAIVPYSITMIDGPYSNSYNNKQYQKLENTDMQKKFFIDRHIKKAKSLAGLIKYEQKFV